MSSAPARSVLVLISLDDSFEDVYESVIQRACVKDVLGEDVNVKKSSLADDGFLAEIHQASLVIADISQSTAAVTFGLGYACGCGVPAIVIQQTRADLPEQDSIERCLPQGVVLVEYDRGQLKKSRSQLIEVLREAWPRAVQDRIAGAMPAAGRQAAREPKPTREFDQKLLHDLLDRYMRLKLAGSDPDRFAQAQRDLFELLSQVAGAPASEDPAALKDIAGILGNCGLILENAQRFKEAEMLYRRALQLCNLHPGVHLQYGDFLADRGRLDEAQRHLRELQRLDPNDVRAATLEVKLALRRGQRTDVLDSKLAADFERDPQAFGRVYLLYLSQAGCPTEKFEKVCGRWEASLPAQEKNIARRVLADHLAGAGDHVPARGLYENMLNSLSGEERHDVLHNLATVCAELKDREAAMKHWTEAYNMDTSDQRVRASFAQRLFDWGERGLANLVSSGQPLPEIKTLKEAETKNKKRAKDKKSAAKSGSDAISEQ